MISKRNHLVIYKYNINEQPPDKINKMACAPSKDTDQPGYPTSLIRAFTVRIKKAWVLSYPLSTQRRLWSDWADAQADLSLRWVHSNFVGFVMRQLISLSGVQTDTEVRDQNLSRVWSADRKIHLMVTIWHHSSQPCYAKQWSRGTDFSVWCR